MNSNANQLEKHHVSSRAMVVVSRKWHEPKITAFINYTEVGAMMDLEDFAKVVIEEVYAPGRKRLVFLSKVELQDRFTKAITKALDEMKAKTSHVA